MARLAGPPGPTAPALGPWRTRANLLSALRLLCAPLLVLAIHQGRWEGALLLFGLAVASDFADGWVARRFGESSAFGGALDHATDATFVVAGLGALAHRGELTAVLPVLVAAAFLQYALDSRVLAGRPLRSSGLGRWNGIAYYVLLGLALFRSGLGLSWPPAALVGGVGWLLVASTGVSMLDRLRALGRQP